MSDRLFVCLRHRFWDCNEGLLLHLAIILLFWIRLLVSEQFLPEFKVDLAVIMQLICLLDLYLINYRFFLHLFALNVSYSLLCWFRKRNSLFNYRINRWLFNIFKIKLRLRLCSPVFGPLLGSIRLLLISLIKHTVFV